MKEFFALLRRFDLKGLMMAPSDNIVIQMFRYLFVGGFAFLVDAGSLWLFVALGVDKFIATAIGFVLGLLVNFALSKWAVFNKEKARVNPVLEFVSYALIGVVGLGITELLVWLGVDVLHFHVMIAKIIAAAIVLVWNFAARKFLLYKKENR